MEGTETKNRAEEERKTGANCFNVANGRQSKLKILDYLHCALSRVPVHTVYNSQAAPRRHAEEQMFRVGRLDLVTTEFRVKNPRNQWKSVYESGRSVEKSCGVSQRGRGWAREKSGWGLDMEQADGCHNFRISILTGAERARYPMCKLSPCILISRCSICRRLRRRCRWRGR